MPFVYWFLIGFPNSVEINSTNQTTNTFTSTAPTHITSKDTTLHVSIPELSNVQSFEGESSQRYKTIKVLPKADFDAVSLLLQLPLPRAEALLCGFRSAALRTALRTAASLLRYTRLFCSSEGALPGTGELRRHDLCIRHQEWRRRIRYPLHSAVNRHCCTLNL